MRQLCVNDGGALKQHLVHKYEVRRIHEELIAQNRLQAAALWVSGQHPQALAFLDYHGSADHRLRIEDEAWKQYTRLIANQPPFVPIAAAPGAIGHFCNCQAEVPLGEMPWHGLLCRKNGGMLTNRHNSIVLALYQHILRNVGPMGIDDFLVARLANTLISHNRQIVVCAHAASSVIRTTLSSVFSVMLALSATPRA
jgi:hypothetical protein